METLLGELIDNNYYMAQYSKIQVLQQMEESGMVPLFYHEDKSVAKDVLKACYEGGARLMEFTNRGDFALEVFTDIIKYSMSNNKNQNLPYNEQKVCIL